MAGIVGTPYAYKIHPDMIEAPEEEVRALRNIVFCEAVTKSEWAICRQNWMRDVEFLRKRGSGILSKTGSEQWLKWGLPKPNTEP